AAAAPASASAAGASAGSSSAVAPGAAAGGIGLQLVDAPVSAGDDPRAQIYIVDHIAPGTVVRRRIEVSDTTHSAAHVDLYAAAAPAAPADPAACPRRTSRSTRRRPPVHVTVARWSWRPCTTPAAARST